MKTRKTLTTLAATALVALMGMGSECELPPPGGDGGVGDGGTDGGGNPTCIDLGNCDPNKYSDTDMGTYDTANYGLLFLDTNNDGVPDTASNANGDIVLIDAFANDQAITYWLLSEVNDQGFLVDTFPGGNTFLNRVYVFVDPSGAKVGDSVVTEAPDGSNYSPLFQVFLVHVPQGYIPDTIKSEATITNAASDPATGIWVEATNTVWVIQLVDASVGLASAAGVNDPELKSAWLGGFKVWGYDIPGGNSDGSMQVANTSTNPGEVPPDPYLSELWQFKKQGGRICGGQNVYLDLYGNLGYSPVPVLHSYEVPTCSSVPRNANDVITEIQNGTYTPNPNRSDIVVVTPQSP
jgi:hypothetical protein